MRIITILPIYCLFLIACTSSTNDSSTIGGDLTGQALADFVITNYKPSSTLGYNTARDTMYAVIDLKPGNQLEGVYSGYTITLDLDADPSKNADDKGINAEHTWPQSMGAGVEPQRSDMHHLFPVKANVNSSRGNNPFGEIPDSETDKWFWRDQEVLSIPPANIDEYAEKENDDPKRFEPREIHKGDCARAMFYFYAMYQSAANQGFWDAQKSTLLQWHYLDATDDWERSRTWKIAEYQNDKPNPFVLDSTLARRIWFSGN
ncbi:MAG: endonuclease [Fidelibacterota bacterium]|nr:MAG: endonuclease [Candidatus Neomarinimicrobiota bacterium]